MKRLTWDDLITNKGMGGHEVVVEGQIPNLIDYIQEKLPLGCEFFLLIHSEVAREGTIVASTGMTPPIVGRYAAQILKDLPNAPEDAY